MGVKERIKDFCKAEKMNISAFEVAIGVANGYVNSISKSIGIDKIEIIIEKFPNLNLEWLLAGKGEMYKESVVSKDVSKDGDCKQTDNVEEENISRRLDDMEKREAQRDFLLTRIADTLDGISKILAHLPENPEKESSVKNRSSLCG